MTQIKYNDIDPPWSGFQIAATIYLTVMILVGVIALLMFAVESGHDSNSETAALLVIGPLSVLSGFLVYTFAKIVTGMSFDAKTAARGVQQLEEHLVTQTRLLASLANSATTPQAEAPQETEPIAKPADTPVDKASKKICDQEDFDIRWKEWQKKEK